MVGVAKITGDEIVIAATQEARAILCRADEVNYLSGPGQGRHPDQAAPATRTGCSASSPRPATATCCASKRAAAASRRSAPTKYEVTGRGGKGRELLQRGQFTRVIPSEVENPQPLDGIGVRSWVDGRTLQAV